MSGEEYRRAMDTLSRETMMPPESAARIERRLLDAFATRDAGSAASSSEVTSAAWRSQSWRRWMPAAAAILLVACAAYVWRANQPRMSVGHESAPPKAADNSRAAPPPVAPTIDRSSPAEVTIAHSPAPNRKPSKKNNVVTPSGFVDLPWTAGLPAFESGEIVRMDIPVASLPAYGIDISSGAGKGPVEADVLIGQDGFARAIRLITTSSRSTQ